MALMALDHVRIFISDGPLDPTDLSRTTPALFFTRWVTHFCAPVFVFLAGAGITLRAQRAGGRVELSRYLLMRGIWLILIELTLNRLAWTFNFDYGHYTLAGVIWMIGWCMLLMALAVHLPRWLVLSLSLAVVAGHDAVRSLPGEWLSHLQGGSFSAPWKVLYFGGPVWLSGAQGKPPILAVLFSIVPWIGVMGAGYCFGTVMTWPMRRRARACLTIGLGAVVTFLLLRAFNLYGEPQPRTQQQSPLWSLISFINTTKYPASLQFLLMTLGPAIAAVPLLERGLGVAGRVLATIGRVPFFFYILHLPLAHACAVVLSLITRGTILAYVRSNHPLMAGPRPQGWGCNLAWVYLATSVIVGLLYFACRWYGRVKFSRSGWLWSLL